MSTVKDSVFEILRAEPGLSNSEVAERVRTRLNSNTTERNISWYITQLARTDMPELPISDVDLEIAASFNEPVVEEEIEYWQQAEDLVLRYEKAKGAKITRIPPSRLLGYDIESAYPSGEVKRISIKSRKVGKMTWLDLTAPETEALLNEPGFWMFIVEGDIQSGKVNIVEIPRAELLKAVKLKLHGRISNLSGFKRNVFSDNGKKPKKAK